jgi:4-amino-4-deoxy-L-arabinose transferase-like glycosyltransferase
VTDALTEQTLERARPQGERPMRHSAVRRWIAPTLPLVPILLVYALRTILLPSLPGDEGSYLAYARDITHGFYADTNLGYLWHGPALPVLLAPLVALHVPLVVMRVIFGPVVLFATLAVFHRLARLYVGDRAALLCTYALALYLPFFMIQGIIWVEPLATLALMLALFFIARSLRGGRRDHIWAGVALALLALTRPEYGYVLLIAAVLACLWLLASRRSPAARSSTLAVVLALVLCTPWLAYTYSLTSKPFYWGNSGGLSLYWMTAPGNLGDWHHFSEGLTSPRLAANRAVFAKLAPLDPVAQDTQLTHIAIQNIKHDPKHYLTNVVNNIDRLIFNSPYSFTNEKASPMFFAIPNGILIGLLSLAVAVAIAARRRLRPEILPVAVFMVLGFAVHVPLAAYARFAVPLVPVIAWLILALLSPHIRLNSTDSPARAPDAYA